MGNPTRIPVRIAEFDDYLTTTDDYLQTEISAGPPPVTNATRLGLSTTQATEWHTRRQDWQTLFPQYTNPVTRTTIITNAVRNFMKSFKTFGQPLLNVMAADADADEADEQVLHFKIGRKEPSRPTTPIEEQCFATIKPLGGGSIRATFRTEHDTARASLAAGADSVLIAAKIDGDAPQSPGDALDRLLVTRASGVHDLGAHNVGKRAYVFFRWYRTKYPDLAGPWSAMQTFVIS